MKYPSAIQLLALIWVTSSAVGNALVSSSRAPKAPTTTTTHMEFFISSLHGENRNNNGTHPGAPWQTLAFASQQINMAFNKTQAAGIAGPGLFVTIALECNSTFLNDPFQIDANIRSTGASIKITQYNCEGTGFQPISLRRAPAPLIQQTRTMTSVRATCLSVVDIAGSRDQQPSSAGSLFIEGLHFSGCAQGVRLSSANGTGVQGNNIVIRGNTFTDMHTPFLRYTPPRPKWAAAIFLEGNYQNFTIRNNIAARIDTFLNSVASILHLLVDGNTVQECGGNCVSMGAAHDSAFENNVFNRDMSLRLFGYGTTDIIVMGMSGHSAVRGNDFNQRGEYQGGPDGCAFDFETSASGFEISDNIFYKSFGSGIMIFGHPGAGNFSNISISRNTFFECGCQNTGPDHSAIAIECGGGRPSGIVKDTTIFKCKGPNAWKPIHVSPWTPNCSQDLKFVNTRIDPPSSPQVIRPEVQFYAPPVPCVATQGSFNQSMLAYNIAGVTRTPNATIRYTLDGSRPTERSPIMPYHGLNVTWPGAVINLNVKGFKEGYLPSVTQGSVLELNYNLCRHSPNSLISGPAGTVFPGGIQGDLETITLKRDNHTNSTRVLVTGWAVDPLLPKGGWGPVTVVLHVDSEPVASTLATFDRPDVVVRGFAPNPQHGFHKIELPEEASQMLLGQGTHILSALAVGTPGSTIPTRFEGGSSDLECTNGVCQGL